MDFFHIPFHALRSLQHTNTFRNISNNFDSHYNSDTRKTEMLDLNTGQGRQPGSSDHNVLSVTWKVPKDKFIQIPRTRVCFMWGNLEVRLLIKFARNILETDKNLKMFTVLETNSMQQTTLSREEVVNNIYC